MMTAYRPDIEWACYGDLATVCLSKDGMIFNGGTTQAETSLNMNGADFSTLTVQ